MTILGTYLSRYQGKITAEAVGRMIGQDVRFVGIRLTSGGSYIDPTWEHNAAMLRDTSILLFPWHFVTTEDAGKQYKNFLAQVEKFDRWRLPPGLDCEAYTAIMGQVFSMSELTSQPDAYNTALSLIKLTDGFRLGASGDNFAFYAPYSLSYPTEATVDSMGRWLTVWMGTQDELADFEYPSIYTNQSSGNKIFKNASMARYLLWVANWHNPSKPPLEKPNLPKVWESTPYYIWQDAIIDGAPYGIQGQVSHELWGPLMPFPDDEPEPPPPDDATRIDLVGASSNGGVWAGWISTQEA